MGERCYLTLKGAGGLSRAEWETEIPAWVFEQLWPGTLGRRLEKTRYLVPHGEHRLEVDEFRGGLVGLWLMECEFESEAAAGQFVPPAWAAAARDVTLDLRYRNASLAVLGLPSPE